MESILSIIFEIFAYMTGKFIVGVLFPKIRIDNVTHNKKAPFKNTRKMIFTKNGVKYMDVLLVSGIGALFWAAIIGIVIISYTKV